MTTSLHFESGYTSAKQGSWRVAPSNLKVVTQPWKDWYAGFDAAVKEGAHPYLTKSGSLRKGVEVGGRKVHA